MKAALNRKINRRLRRIAMLAWVAALAGTSQQGWALTHWDTSGTGSWFNASNWTNGVPVSGEEALMANGGTARVTGGVAEAFQIRLEGPTGGRIEIDGAGAELRVADDTAIGASSNGSMTVRNGGMFSTVVSQLNDDRRLHPAGRWRVHHCRQLLPEFSPLSRASGVWP